MGNVRLPWFIRREFDYADEGALVLVVDPQEWLWRLRQRVRAVRAWAERLRWSVDFSGPWTFAWPMSFEQAIEQSMRFEMAHTFEDRPPLGLSMSFGGIDRRFQTWGPR